VNVSDLFYWIVTEPILSKKALKSFLSFTDDFRERLFIRTQNIECPHGSFGPTYIEKSLIEILKGLDVFSPTASVNIRALHMPVGLNSRLLQFFHKDKKLLSNPCRDLVEFLCVNLSVCLIH
jgi:hypothetical protein